MRTIQPIDALLSRLRQQILSAILLRPQHRWYLSDLARHLNVRPSSLQRDLAALSRAGIFRRSRDGNRVYYAVEPDSPLLPELRGLLVKTVGLADVLRRALQPLAANIRCAFIYGSVARGQEHAGSDIDVFVIGTVGLASLAPAFKKAEAALGRPINPTVYRQEEFVKNVRSGHHFLQTVLASPKLFLLGDDRDVATPSGPKPPAKARDEHAGTRRSAGRRGPRSARRRAKRSFR